MESDSTSAPDPSPEERPGQPDAELLTLPEAAVLTGLSVKALTRRIERGSLPAERHGGRRVVRKGELERRRLIGAGRIDEGGGGELLVWREMHRQAVEKLAERDAELAATRQRLAHLEGAIAGAGAWTRVKRLRRLLAAQSD